MLKTKIGDKPDLYGPFWIYTSVIFLLAIVENINNFFDSDKDRIVYDVARMPSSLLVTYFVGFCVPVVLAFLVKKL